jgi:hypothetical protein
MRFLFTFAIAISLLVPMSSAVFAEQQQNNTTSSSQKYTSQSWSLDDTARANHIAQADKDFQKYLNGRFANLADVEFASNEATHGVAYPVLRYTIAGKDSLYVMVDLDKGVVKNVTYAPDSVFPAPKIKEPSYAELLIPLIVPISVMAGIVGVAVAIVFVISKRRKSNNLAA